MNESLNFFSLLFLSNHDLFWKQARSRIIVTVSLQSSYPKLMHRDRPCNWHRLTLRHLCTQIELDESSKLGRNARKSKRAPHGALSQRIYCPLASKGRVEWMKYRSSSRNSNGERWQTMLPIQLSPQLGLRILPLSVSSQLLLLCTVS